MKPDFEVWKSWFIQLFIPSLDDLYMCVDLNFWNSSVSKIITKNSENWALHIYSIPNVQERLLLTQFNVWTHCMTFLFKMYVCINYTQWNSGWVSITHVLEICSSYHKQAKCSHIFLPLSTSNVSYDNVIRDIGAVQMKPCCSARWEVLYSSMRRRGISRKNGLLKT